MSPSAADSLLGRLTFDESLSEEPERYRYLAPPGPSTMESPFSASSAQFGSSDMLRAASWQHPHLAPLFGERFLHPLLMFPTPSDRVSGIVRASPELAPWPLPSQWPDCTAVTAAVLWSGGSHL